MHKPDNEQKDDRADGRSNSGGDNATVDTVAYVNAATQLDAKPWQQPTTDQRAYNANADVTDQPGPGTFDNDTGEPAGNETDH
jgi:hypothetical protein